MKPVLFEFVLWGHLFTLFTYDLFNLMMNPLIFIGLGTYILSRKGVTVKKALISVGLIALTVIVGARIMHVLLGLRYYIENSINPFSLSASGFTMFGGFIFVIPMIIWLAKRLKIDVWSLLDSISPGWALGIMFNKIGCFLNGCCFGVLTSLPIGVVYPKDSVAYEFYHPGNFYELANTVYLADLYKIHPVQLYESAIGLIGLALVLYLMKKKMKVGVPFAAFAVLYSVSRVVFHVLRATPHSVTTDPKLVFILYVGIAICAVTVLFSRLKTQN